MKIVTISYDYELCWGVWDVVAKDYSESNVANSNNAAQCLIELHREFQIPATWAVVGAAVDYGKSLSERMRSCNRSPKVVTMLERFAEALDFESKYFEIPKDFLHAVERENELFELASHTYGHVYSNFKGDYSHSDDAYEMRRILGPKAVSTVFPKNIITPEVALAANRNGFSVLRVNPDNVIYRNQAESKFGRTIQRYLRFSDAFVPLQECMPCGKYEYMKQGGFSVGQYFIRPYQKVPILSFLHAARNRMPLNSSLIRDKNIHFWSHPHNFGYKMDVCFKNYRLFFETLARLRDNRKINFALMRDVRVSM